MDSLPPPLTWGSVGGSKSVSHILGWRVTLSDTRRSLLSNSAKGTMMAIIDFPQSRSPKFPTLG